MIFNLSPNKLKGEVAFLFFRPYFVTAYCTPSWFFWQYAISVFSQKPLANYSRSPTFLFVGICRDKVCTAKKERTNSLSQYNMSRTIGRTLSRKRHHRIWKRESAHQDKNTTRSATEFHFQVVYGRKWRIKKVAHFVPLSCFHWHISCRFWTFDDITETPGSAWAITESDSSFPLCSLNAFYKTNIPPFR